MVRFKCLPLLLPRAENDLFVLAYSFWWINERIIPGHWVFSDSFQYLRPKAHSIKKGKGKERRAGRGGKEGERTISEPSGWLGWGSGQQLVHSLTATVMSTGATTPLVPTGPQKNLNRHQLTVSQSKHFGNRNQLSVTQRRPVFPLPLHPHSPTSKPPLLIKADVSKAKEKYQLLQGRQAFWGYSAR